MSLTERNDGFDIKNSEASNPNTPEMEMLFDYLEETLKVLKGYKDVLEKDPQQLDFISEKSLSLLEEVIKQIDQMYKMIDEWLNMPASMNVVQIFESRGITIRLQNTQECLQSLPENRERARPQLKIEFVLGMGGVESGVSFKDEIIAQSYRPRGKTGSFSACPEKVLDESYKRSEADFNLRIGIEYLFKNLDTGLLKCDRGPTVEFSALVRGGVIARIIYFVGFTPHYYGPVDIGINREHMDRLKSDFLNSDGLFNKIKANFEKTNKQKKRYNDY